MSESKLPPSIDQDVLKTLADLAPVGSPLSNQLFEIFLEDTPSLLARAATEADEDSDEALHALRSSSAQVGAARLAELARLAQEALRQGKRKAYRTWVGELLSDFEVVRTYFERMLSGESSAPSNGR